MSRTASLTLRHSQQDTQRCVYFTQILQKDPDMEAAPLATLAQHHLLALQSRQLLLSSQGVSMFVTPQDGISYTLRKISHQASCTGM